MKFYKGVLRASFDSGSQLRIPGTVTTSISEALMWKERIQSNKKKGIHKNIHHGEAIIVEIIYDGELAGFEEFQRSGVTEHSRGNCWTSAAKTKAQINTACAYRTLTLPEIEQLISEQANSKWRHN